MASAVASGRHSDAIDFLSLGALATLAHPTYDHFLPFLYSLGLVEPGRPVQTFCEGFQWPGISMRLYCSRDGYRLSADVIQRVPRPPSQFSSAWAAEPRR